MTDQNRYSTEELKAKSTIQLQQHYKELTSYNADGRWGHKKLIEEISKRYDEEDEARRQQESRDAEQAARKAEREANATARADFDAWCKEARQSEELWGLMRAVRDARKKVERFQAEMEEFTVRLAKNPTHALSWSNSFFEDTARHQVAEHLIELFESGVPSAEIVADFEVEFLRLSCNPNRSTSTTRNLMDDMLRCALAQTFECLTRR